MMRHRSAFVIVLLILCQGCGGFLLDGGLFPLPTIHLVFPMPSEYGLDYEDVRLASSNGQTIYGWFIPADGARATVLIHHGAVENRSGSAGYYRLFHELGYHVLIYDYQGFGESLWLATLNTILPDAEVALAHLQERNEPGTDKIILFGFSMGTLPALTQVARNPQGVLGVILEGSFVPQSLPVWSFYPLGITPSPEAFLNVPEELNPRLNAAQTTLPKLFLQSREDRVTPFSGAEELFELAAEPKHFEELAGKHIQAVEVDPNYRDYIAAFLEQVTADDEPD